MITIISGNDDEGAVLKALQASAKGFFIKGCDIDTPEIYNAIATVMNGKFYFNEFTHSLILEDSNRKTSRETHKIEFSSMSWISSAICRKK
jgi:DNA-binding NarL/FixJ family response regulator